MYWTIERCKAYFLLVLKKKGDINLFYLHLAKKEKSCHQVQRSEKADGWTDVSCLWW